MVTFAAATKNSSSFPTRAPAQRRVDHFVAITCSIPSDSCDLYSDDCRSYAQLVSPSRDPIGYRDGKLLYKYCKANPSSKIDPSGKLVPVVCGVAITAVAVTTAAVIIVGTVVVSQEIVGEIVDAVAPETEVITQASTEIKEEIPKTCDQMGAKKCDPRMIDYVSGDPKKACKACNDSTYTNENEQRREEDPPFDFIDSDGFIFGTVSHWVCKTKGQKQAGTSVLCGSCCEDTVDGYALRRKCKCAPTGGW